MPVTLTYLSAGRLSDRLPWPSFLPLSVRTTSKTQRSTARRASPPLMIPVGRSRTYPRAWLAPSSTHLGFPTRKATQAGSAWRRYGLRRHSNSPGARLATALTPRADSLQVVKEHKLYSTYEQFFASDSQTFLVKKYARVCIVSDEFLVSRADAVTGQGALRGPAARTMRRPMRRRRRETASGVTCSESLADSQRTADLSAPAGTRPQHRPRHRHDNPCRGMRCPEQLESRPVFLYWRLSCTPWLTFASSPPPPETGPCKKRLRRHAALHPGAEDGGRRH